MAWLSHPDTWEVARRSIEFDVLLACCISTIAIRAEGGAVSAVLPDLVPKIFQRTRGQGGHSPTV